MRTDSPMSSISKAGSRGGSHPKAINLALQGGGAHGAFTWGVLDRLLADGRIVIEGISATSAGAMNAAVLAQGLLEGGPAAARKALEEFWRRVSLMAAASPLQQSWIDRLFGGYEPGFLAVLSDVRFHDAGALALSVQPVGHQSAARAAGGQRRFRRACAPAAASSCSSPRPTCAPARSRCSSRASCRPAC